MKHSKNGEFCMSECCRFDDGQVGIVLYLSVPFPVNSVFRSSCPIHFNIKGHKHILFQVPIYYLFNDLQNI